MQQIPEYDYYSRNQATCSNCGAARRPEDKIFRLVYIDIEGYFDLCSTCVTEMAHDLGLWTQANVQKVVDENNALKEQLAERARVDAELVRILK